MRDKKLIQFYTTTCCNSHCRTCDIWKCKEYIEEIDPQVVKNVVLAFPDADYVIGGGEAILYSNIKQIILMMNANGVKPVLLSNCIDVARLESLLEEVRVKSVTISYDGISHDSVRRSQFNLSNILKFKRWADNFGIDYTFSYTLSKFNEHEVDDDFEFFNKMLGGGKLHTFIALDMDVFYPDGKEKQETFQPDCPAVLLRHAKNLYDKDFDCIKNIVNRTMKNCTSQNCTFTVYSNGDLIRCQGLRANEVIANLNGLSSDEIKNVFNSVKNDPCKFSDTCFMMCQRRYD